MFYRRRRPKISQAQPIETIERDRSRRCYNGIIGGDENFFDSSDQGSVESCNEDEDDELPHRVESKKLAYDPSYEISLWEIGIVFESANQFRETIAKYAVVRGCN
ncbi:conserved hypothetical protein [Ricinus communis]|uniref:Uncharacterized protein n=1 Tax=Ricinus communis TaxID=3988 RepID=B9RVJ5_RICCO|nr:conserved hypothetical protein [Ricinus communis]